jgi:hypothetical protein
MDIKKSMLQWGGLIALIYCTAAATAMPRITPELKNASVFLFHNENGKDFVGHGTGFFIRFQNPSAQTKDACYLVTAKHVLYLNDKPLESLTMRLNKKGGDAEMRKINLVLGGPAQNVWFHADGVADAAVVQIDCPDTKEFNITLLSNDMILTRQIMTDLRIAEGSEMFYSGMLIHHIGTEGSAPHVRCGRLSLIPTEKVNWEGARHELYLADVTIFGGSSGSPAFFAWYRGDDEDGRSECGFKLGGIMIGAINIKTGDNVDNSGISAITPGFKLYEILYSEPVKAARGY